MYGIIATLLATPLLRERMRPFDPKEFADILYVWPQLEAHSNASSPRCRSFIQKLHSGGGLRYRYAGQRISVHNVLAKFVSFFELVPLVISVFSLPTAVQRESMLASAKYLESRALLRWVCQKQRWELSDCSHAVLASISYLIHDYTPPQKSKAKVLPFSKAYAATIDHNGGTAS
jgi:hypothetical protein